MRDCSEYCTFSISRVLELFSSAHKNTQTVEYPPFLMQVKDSVRMFEKMNFEKSGEGQSQRPASSASTSMGYLMHPPEGYHSSTQSKSQPAPKHRSLYSLKNELLDSADLPQYDRPIEWQNWSDQECISPPQIHKNVCA